MKRVGVGLLFVLVIVSAFSCGKHDGKLQEIQERIQIPIWSEEDLERSSTASIVVYKNTSNSRPPFYRGRMPLVFENGETPGRGYVVGITPLTIIILFYQFEDFRNTFVIAKNAPIIIGARTTDNTGQLVAEARLDYFTTDKNKQGIEAEEFHYGPGGKLIFKCKSRIDPYSGFKEKETDVIGKKIKEYYFIWPSQFE